MIVRQFCARQSRNLLGLNRTRAWSRFQSTEAESIQTATQAPPASSTSSAPSPRQAWGTAMANRRSFQQMGSSVTTTYEPETLITNPPHPQDITLELLLASQSHLGHATALWNPQNARYIFGIREGVHIISLDATASHLRRAAKVVEEVARMGGVVLFVGTRKKQKRAVVRAAELAQGYHIFERWIPGSLTNGQQILGRCDMKVVDPLDREVSEFKDKMSKRPVLKPDLVVCLNPLENEVLLHECGIYNVPTIGIIDTDADPTRVTYPIPANDDSLRCVQVIAGVLGRAGQRGQQRRLEETKAGAMPYERVSEEDITYETRLTGSTPVKSS